MAPPPSSSTDMAKQNELLGECVLFRRVVTNILEYCRKAQIPEPVFNIISDRRGKLVARGLNNADRLGGRTAWSSTVTVQGRNIAARYWYDGQFINNAKEDAAEMALMQFAQPSISSPGSPGQAVFARGWSR